MDDFSSEESFHSHLSISSCDRNAAKSKKRRRLKSERKHIREGRANLPASYHDSSSTFCISSLRKSLKHRRKRKGARKSKFTPPSLNHKT